MARRISGIDREITVANGWQRETGHAGTDADALVGWVEEIVGGEGADRGPPMPSKRSGGMVTGMATRKLTITLETDQLDRIRALVEAGEARSVSGFVHYAVGVALDDVAGWGAMLADALEATGGEISVEERRWADEALGNTSRRRSPAA